MKKIKYIFSLILIILLTSCSSYDMTMEIDKDKSMDFTVTVLSDSEEDEIAGNITIYKEKLEQYGYLVNEYNEDDKYGMIISKHYDNIDDISLGERKDEFDLLYFYNNDYSSEIESKMFNVDKGIDTNRYAANFYVDLSNLDIDLNNTTVTFKVVVPNGTVSNNANLVDYEGNELIWKITSLDKTEIDFVFELNSYEYIYYAIAVIIAVFLVFSIFSNLFGSSKGSTSKKNNNINRKVVKNNPVIDMDKKNEKPSNKTVNVDNLVKNNKTLVPEVAINNEAKRINGKKKSKEEHVNLEVVPNIKENNGFSNMITNIQQSQNSSFNTENNNLSNPFGNDVNSSNNFDIPVVGGNGYVDGNFNNNQTINNNPSIINNNLDVNRSSDFIQNQSQNSNQDNALNNEYDDSYVESIIKVNNKDVVVNKKKDEL